MFKGTVCCFNIDISCSKVQFAVLTSTFHVQRYSFKVDILLFYHRHFMFKGTVLKSTFCCFNVNISCSKVEFAVLTSTFHVQRYSLLF